jgi:hypothetical protein
MRMYSDEEFLNAVQKCIDEYNYIDAEITGI